MAKREVSIVIRAKDEASKVINNLASGGIPSLIKSIGAAGAAYVSLGGAINVLKSAVHEALEAEKATAKLTQAIKAQSLSVATMVPHLTKYAQALSETAIASDEAVMSAQAMLISIGGLTGTTLDRATKAALDLSAGLGIDLEQAAERVAKAAVGNVREWSRLGVEFDKTATDADKLNTVLGFIHERFGGAAQAEIATTAGRIHELNEAFTELLETIGGKVLGRTGSIEGLTDFFRAVSKYGFNIRGIGNAMNQIREDRQSDSIFSNFAEEWGLGLAKADPILEAVKKEIDGILEAQEKAKKSAEEYAKALERVLENSKRVIQEDIRAKPFDTTGAKAIGPGTPSFGLALGAARVVGEGIDLDRQTRQVNAMMNAVIALQGEVGSVEEAWERITEVYAILEEGNATMTDDIVALGNALLETAKKTEGLGKQIDNALAVVGTNAALQFGDTLVDAAFGAEIAWDQFFKSLMADIAKAIVATLILKAISGIFGGVAASGGAVVGTPIGGGTFGMASGGMVPSYAAGGFSSRGTDIVPAMLTPGEIVLPRGVSHDILGGRASVVPAGQGGGRSVHLTVVAMDAQSFEGFLTRNPKALRNALDHMDARGY